MTSDLVYTQIFSALFGSVIFLFALTWKASPFVIPTNQKGLRIFFNAIPVLIVSCILVVLYVWLSRCSNQLALTLIGAGSLIFCIGFMLLHWRSIRLKRTSPILLTVIGIIWASAGPISICTFTTLLLVRNQSEDAYQNTPLKLEYVYEGAYHVVTSPIYRFSETPIRPVHFKASMRECDAHDPRMDWIPKVGVLTGASYMPPPKIDEEQSVIISAIAPCHGDVKKAQIILMPDPKGVQRKQIKGTDKAGESALFDFVILSNTSSWVFENDEYLAVTTNAARTQMHVCTSIRALQDAKLFFAYDQIIALGTASSEGSAEEEATRANNRGHTIAKWINASLKGSGQKKLVYSINLGQFRSNSSEIKAVTPDQTTHERPVVLVGVIGGSKSNLNEAFKNALETAQNSPYYTGYLQFIANNYRAASLESYSALPQQTATSASSACFK